MARASTFPLDAALVRTSRVPRVASSTTTTGPLQLVSAIVGAALVTAALIFLVWVKMSQVQLGYDIHAAQSELVRLRQERSALEVEVTALRRPERLLRIARDRLDLRPPRPEQLIVVGEGGGAP